MNIVILDAFTTNPGDLNWTALEKLGRLEIYERTPKEMVFERAKDADIILSNKVTLGKEMIEKLTKLQCICVLATGFNNVDIEYAKTKNIPVCNVIGYSSESVAQHVFALILALTNKVESHAFDVEKGSWENSIDWSYQLNSLVGLSGKTMGIYGFGKIGRKVAKIALAFDMKVISLHKHPERDQTPQVEFVSEERLFRESDFLSLHAPLTDSNKHFVNKNTFKLMKKSAILINTGRGGLVNEKDMRNALENGVIAAAGLDVLSEEPPKNGNILIGAKNCLITPHQAWGTRESRAKLISETVLNVKAFLDGKPRNVVNDEL